VLKKCQSTLQGNSGRIDRNMSESRCPKLQKIDRKLSKMTESWQKMSELTIICPKWQKSVKFLSNFRSLGHLDSDMFCQFGHCFLVLVAFYLQIGREIIERCINLSPSPIEFPNYRMWFRNVRGLITPSLISIVLDP
jgi:hypothetical protein